MPSYPSIQINIFGGSNARILRNTCGAYNHSVMVAVYPGTIITPAEVSSSFGVSIPKENSTVRGAQEDFPMRMITVLLALLLVCPAVFAAD